MEFAEELWVVILSFLLGLPIGLLATAGVLFAGEILPRFAAGLPG